jgi:hypothetical protein
MTSAAARDPACVALTAVVGTYNAIQNLVVPQRWYTAANVAVTGGLVVVRPPIGCSPMQKSG